MLCDQVREHLSAYLDRELTADLSAAVRAHLDACADCRALADDLRATADLLGRLPARPAPGHLADDVMREIERRGILAIGAPAEPEPRQRTLPMRRASLWPRALAVAATVVLAVGIGILAYLGEPGRKAPPAAPAPAPASGVADKSLGTPKVSHEPKSPGDLYVAAVPKPAEKGERFGMRQLAPAAVQAEKRWTELESDALALARKKTEPAGATSSLSIEEGGGAAASNYALATRGHGLVDAAARLPDRPVTLGKAGTGQVVLAGVNKEAAGYGNYGLVGRTWDFNGDVGQITINLGAAQGVGTFSGIITSISAPAGTLESLEIANGRTVTLYGAGTTFGLTAARPPAALAPLQLNLSGANSCTGGTTVTGGTLDLSGSGKLGATSSARTVGGGTTTSAGLLVGGGTTESAGTLVVAAGPAPAAAAAPASPSYLAPGEYTGGGASRPPEPRKASVELKVAAASVPAEAPALAAPPAKAPPVTAEAAPATAEAAKMEVAGTDTIRPARPPAPAGRTPAGLPAALAPAARGEIAAVGGDSATGGVVEAGKPAAAKTLGLESQEVTADRVAAADKLAAGKAHRMERHDAAALEQTMLAAAAGEAGIDRLSQAATGDAVRAADNQLVLRAESPDAADRNLVELFRAAGWRSLAVDRERSAVNKEGTKDDWLREQEPRAGAAGYFAGGPVAGGVYYRATRNGENVWLVLADRDSISRFGSRLAQAQGLTVAAESSAEFRALRGLQKQLRQQSELAKAEKFDRRASDAKGFGAAPAAAPAPERKPGGWSDVNTPAPAAPAAPPAAPTPEQAASRGPDVGAEARKPEGASGVGRPAPALDNLDLAVGARAPAAPAPAAATAGAKTAKGGEAGGAVAAAKPAPAGEPSQRFSSQAEGRREAGGQSGGSGAGGVGSGVAGGAPLKGTAASFKAKVDEKAQSLAEDLQAKAPEVKPPSGPAPADRMLLVIRVQPILASRAEAERAAPAATQPAEKVAP